jgi:hypothetical protein
MAQLLPALDPALAPCDPDPTALQDLSDAAVLFVDRWRLPLDDRCLPRALSLYQCLRREGLPVQLVFGVRPGLRIEEGHAWLQMRGEPLLEPADRMQGFVPVFLHPPAPPTPRNRGGFPS